MIIQCLRTVKLVDICSDLICLQSQWFRSEYFMKAFRKWSEEASIFSKLHGYENIHKGFSFLVTLKVDFCNNVLLQIFSLEEFYYIEIRVLLSATLQKELLQVSFLGISKKNILQRCIQTQSNI